MLCDMTGIEETALAQHGEMLSRRLPDEFFIFVNQANPVAENNYRLTKTFSSRFAGRLQPLDDAQADPMPFIPNPNVDPSLNPFVLSVTNDYEIEWNAELGREVFAPQAPSRMSAIYAFGDVESCQAVGAKYGWPLKSVRRFELVNSAEARVVRVNMEVVSLLRGVNRLASWSAEDHQAIWSHYWTGHGELSLQVPDTRAGQAWATHTSGVIWEYLIEGVVHSSDDTPVFA